MVPAPVARYEESAASLAELLAAPRGRSRRVLADVHRSYLQAITTLGRIVQARDPETAGRTERLTRVARAVGAELGLGPDDLHALTVGVLVHDIGKVGLADDADPRLCPELSARILETIELPAIVKDMAVHRLERYDGSGVPDRRTGEDIPLAARIMAAAEALEAATVPTPARPALPMGAAIDALRRQAGTRLCPRVVDALEAALRRDTDLRRYFADSGDPETAPLALAG